MRTAASWSRRRGLPSTCRRSRARRWTASHCARRTRRASFPVVARIAAGVPAGRALAAGEAMGIATGGVVPDGADAVIPIEYVVEHDNVVEIRDRVDPGANVRPRGGDVGAGDTVVEAGHRLGPAQLGALAAAGVAEVRCAIRPRASVLTTGTELRPPGEPLGAGEVYEANGLILAAQLRSAGAQVERLAAVVDEEAAHREVLARGLESDVLVTSGGVSVRPARSRAARRGGARSGGGLLARGGQAGQADRVRRSRIDAGLRPAGEPGLGAGRLRVVRPPGGAGAPGPRRSSSPLRAGAARGCREAKRGARRARPRTHLGRRRRGDRARAAGRARSRT